MIWRNYLLLLLVIGPLSLLAQLSDSTFLSGAILERLDQINTTHSEFSPVFCNDGIAYVYFEQKTKNDQPVRGEIEFDLRYFNTVTGVTSSFSEDINSELIEGPFFIVENTIYFTRSNTAVSNNGQRKLKIFQSTQEEDGSWTKPEMIAFPAGDFNFCHPSLNATGEIMVFASDLSGGFGKMDLYFSKKIDGQWTRPENLGPLVNGVANEWYPFWIKDKLFYASDSYPSYGKLDLYEITFENLELRNRKVLAPPLNSAYDDFGLAIHPEGKRVMFSSARIPRKKDDLYSLSLTESLLDESLPETVSLELNIVDELSEKGIAEVEVYIHAVDLDAMGISDDNEREILAKTKQLNSGTSFKLTSDDLGKQVLDLDAGDKYVLVLKKDGYKEQRFYYNPQERDENWIILMSGSEVYDQFYGKTKKVIPKNTNVSPVITIPVEKGETIVFKNIYYQYNSAAFIADAQYELDALAQVMQSNPTMRVLLSSHTDARGKDAYNLDLSKQRAETAKQYLISKGIASYRVHTEGKGEIEIINHCKNGVSCTEAEHLFNRRTELRILEN